MTPPLPPVIIRIDGVPHLLERIALDDLVDWRTARNLRAAGAIGGPDDWPPVILYERTANEPTD